MSKATIQRMRQSNSSENYTIEGYNGSMYDDKMSEMIIFILSSANKNQASNQIKKLYPNVPFRIEVNDDIATEDHSRGGATLIGNDGGVNNGGRCTTGFVARDRLTNEVGVVTAGHCDFSRGEYSAPDGSKYNMVRKKWDMNNKLDLAFFWSSHTPTSEFYPTSSATPRSLVGWTSVANTEEETILKTGSFLCHYGIVSATQSCGEVTDKTFEPPITRGCGKPGLAKVPCGPNFVRVDKRYKSGQVALQCIGGDSGGPWFAYGNAYGINKGGVRTVETDKNTCKYAFYTPIERINDLNLTLWYGGAVTNGIAQ